MQQRAGRLPPLTSASIQREADLAAHAPPTLRASLVRRQLPPQSQPHATRQRRSDAKKRLACAMTTPHRHRTHPSDSRSRGLPEQRLSLRFAFARILGKAKAHTWHCLPGGATRQARARSLTEDEVCVRPSRIALPWPSPTPISASRFRICISVMWSTTRAVLCRPGSRVKVMRPMHVQMLAPQHAPQTLYSCTALS